MTITTLPEWDYADRLIVVTGATGLYGRELVPRLVARGARVRTVSGHPLPDGFYTGGGAVDHHHGDLAERTFADRIMVGADGLFHLAARRGSIGIQTSRAATMLSDNILIGFTTLEAARCAGVERILYTSTVTVYPKMEVYREDEAWSAPPEPVAEYAAWSKRMVEKLIEAYKVQYGMANIALVRPVNTFGPHDDFEPETALVVPALIRRAMNGEEPLTVWGDGTAVRDILFVSDAVDGILAAFDRGCGLGPFNLGTGCGYSIREIVEAILKGLGISPTIRWDTDKPSGEPRKVADIERAKRILGFEPKIGLEEGIARTIRWYRAKRGTE